MSAAIQSEKWPWECLLNAVKASIHCYSKWSQGKKKRQSEETNKFELMCHIALDSKSVSQNKQNGFSQGK